MNASPNPPEDTVPASTVPENTVLLSGRSATTPEWVDYFSGKTLVGPDQIDHDLFEPLGGRLFLVTKSAEYISRFES